MCRIWMEYIGVLRITLRTVTCLWQAEIERLRAELASAEASKQKLQAPQIQRPNVARWKTANFHRAMHSKRMRGIS